MSDEQLLHLMQCVPGSAEHCVCGKRGIWVDPDEKYGSY